MGVDMDARSIILLLVRMGVESSSLRIMAASGTGWIGIIFIRSMRMHRSQGIIGCISKNTLWVRMGVDTEACSSMALWITP